MVRTRDGGRDEGVWQKARADFSEYAFFEEVHYDWFEKNGWFDASKETSFEDRFMERLLGRLGTAGTDARRRIRAVKKQRPDADDPRLLALCMRTAELAAAMDPIRSLEAAVKDLAASYPNRYDAAPFLRELGRLKHNPHRTVRAGRGTR